MTIQRMLNAGDSFSEIGKAIGKDPTSISREVRRHTVLQRSSKPYQNYNNCKNRFGCEVSHLCDPCKAPQKHRFCRRCSYCNKVCPNFEPDECRRFLRPPYVCNGCGKIRDCPLEQRFYKAEIADKDARALLSESRSGITLTREELERLDRIVSPLVLQHQSPHHICVNNRDVLMVSERTIYHLIASRIISVRNIDLPRKVRFKVRKVKSRFKVDKSCRVGRTWDCFKAFLEDHPDAAVVQLDSVEGKKGGKVLLTIHFVKCEMMLAFLRSANDAKSVSQVFEHLWACLGSEAFKRLFFVLLADNGSEFSNPAAIEFGPDHQRRAYLFYCDPCAPYQKGSCERNHEFIRCFIPKGKNMDPLSQNEISLMMDHINSYARKSLGNKSPYEVFRFLYGDGLLERLGCTLIPPQEVTLNSSIWKWGLHRGV